MALLCAALVWASPIVACTPKPVSAKPVAQEFLDAFGERTSEALTGIVDNPTDSSLTLEDTFAGLQAEGVSATLNDIEQSESIATAHYTVNWDLPKERELSYDTSMTLTKAEGKWLVRWQPSTVHPKLGARQHLELRAEPAQRASIVSSDGVELLKPGLSYRLLVDKTNIDDVRPLAAQVSEAVNALEPHNPGVRRIDAGELARELEAAGDTYSVATFDDKVGPRLEAELAGVEGVRLNQEPALVSRDRHFAPDMMARVRTIVNEDVDGAQGWNVSIVNENGAALEELEGEDPQPAPAIKLGLDYDVQRAAEKAVDLRPEMEAMMVAIRPSTGEILAVAQTDKADKKGDVALAGQYPPGSVFKIITAASGLQKQGLHTESIVPCPGTMDIYGRIVTNYNSFDLGNIPFRESFAQSCNTTFADISTRLEKGELKKVGKQFGLGRDYKVPGLTTITGSIPEGKTALEKTEAGYGQGYDLASPFGMALVSATVAAGKTPNPYLVSTHKPKQTDKSRPIDKHTLSSLRTMMRATVTEGTARGISGRGDVHGKTGEAEVNGGSHAWFTGYRGDIAFATLVVMGGGSDVSVAITDEFFKNLDEYRKSTTGLEKNRPAPAQDSV